MPPACHDEYGSTVHTLPRTDPRGRGRTPAGEAWVDGHCHLDMVEDRARVLADLADAGVVGVITVGTDLASSRAALDIARTDESVWATVGLHPHDASNGMAGIRSLIDEALDEGVRLVAIGECGLDYHYDNSPRADQRAVFADQIALAHEFDLPLVVHTRDAWEDTLGILDAESVPARTVIHCFTGGVEEAQACLERGAHLSISGVVTFRSAGDVRDAVRSTPLNRLIVETDSPFLTPVPHRGRPNTPLMVPLVGAAVAEVKGLPVAEVAAATTANASRLYGMGLIDEGMI